MDQAKTQRLNLYRLLIKSGDFPSIKPKASKYPYEHERDGNLRDLEFRLFVQRNRPGVPKWYEFIKPILLSKQPVRSISSSFIMFLKRNRNVYALSGGYGYSAIPREIIDDDFGIDLGTRLIKEISSLTQKTMRGETRQIRRAVIGYRPELDVDNHSRFLQTIEGKSVDDYFGTHIAGKASVSFTKDTELKELPNVIKMIERKLQEKPLIRFPRSYELVKEVAEIDRLERALINELNKLLKRKGDYDALYPEFKDLFTQFKCQDFYLRVNYKREKINYFSLENIFGILITLGFVKFENLKDLSRIRIDATDDMGQPVFERVPLLDFLVYEVDRGSNFYLLHSRKWYRILDEHISYVDEEIRQLPVDKGMMPDWDEKKLKGPKREESYNVSASSAKKWENLDQKLVRRKDQTTVEVCDLYDKKAKRLIHVKKVWGSKTSYLLAQGLISGISLHDSSEFRAACNRKWPTLFSKEYQRNMKITFAIADNRSLDRRFPNNLSYFARLNLASVASQLASRGYDVRLAPIRVRT